MADSNQQVDLVVIGGGPAGYPAAISAAKAGLKVVCIEFDNAGGTCLNWGCIPTKTMIGSVAALETARHAKDFGLKIDEAGFDFGAVMARKDKIVSQLVGGVEFLFKKYSVRYVKGKGKIVDKNTVEATTADGKTEKIPTKNILISTGSVPAKVPIPGLDGGGKDSDVFIDNSVVKARKASGELAKTSVWTSNEAVSTNEVPKNLVILGAGVIGVEFAYVYANLGSKVTVIELMPTIVPTVDPEITAELAKIFDKMGVTMMTATKVTAVDVAKRKVKYTSEKGGDGEVSFDKLLVAVGRTPYTEGLGLEQVGVKMDKRKIIVDEYLRTNIPNIYAVGDVIGGKYMLAHMGTREGEVAVENILGHATKIDRKACPACIYTEPEIATTGMTEQEAKDAGYDVQVGRFTFKNLGKAMAINETVGLVKIVSEKKYGEILGGHIIGPHASDLIHEICVSMKLESTIDELMHTIHAHPSLSEAVMEAAQDVKGQSVHK